MTGARHLAGAAATLCALLAAVPVAAGTVSVTAKSTAGAPAGDVVVVFDPLDATPPPSHPTAVIDQVNKTYVPHVSVVRTGTTINFPNSDRIHHQVYSFSPAKQFQLDLYAGSTNSHVLFDKPGLVVLGCNIHDRMLAFVVVVDTPYFTKTAATGAARLELPPGHYSVRTWHPDLTAAAPVQRITVGDGPLELPVVLDLSGSPDNLATWH
jgi:plastocyanin